MEKYMKIAYKEAEKAYKNGEVPVGAVIVKDNIVVSKAYNKKEKYQCTTKHAEIIAIEKACKKLKTWHLDDCEIYITMEPCMMCTGAIIQSRIKKIYYAIENEKFGYLNKIDTKKIKICTKCHHEGKCLKGDKMKCDCFLDEKDDEKKDDCRECK